MNKELSDLKGQIALFLSQYRIPFFISMISGVCLGNTAQFTHKREENW